MCPDLDKGDLASAHVALCVPDDYLAIVLQPALLTQHIVDARHSLVPFIVITVSAEQKGAYFISSLYEVCVMTFICHNIFPKMATLFSPKKRQLNQYNNNNNNIY